MTFRPLSDEEFEKDVFLSDTKEEEGEVEGEEVPEGFGTEEGV